MWKRKPFEGSDNPLEQDSISSKQAIWGIISILLIVFTYMIYNWQKKNFPKYSTEQATMSSSFWEDAKDEDGDGLSNGREKEIGTNPKIADTDGDGFSDYEEIQSGYNPLGEGELTKQQKYVSKKEISAKIDRENETLKCDEYDNIQRKPKCYMSIARYFKDEELCRTSGLSDINLMDCMVEVGIEKKDKGVCTRLYPETKAHMNNPEFQDARKLIEIQQDICYLSFYTHTGDKSVCSRIKNIEYRNLCNETGQETDWQISVKGISVGIKRCNSINPPTLTFEDKYTKNDCLRSEALKQKNPSICALIEKIEGYENESDNYENVRGHCYFDVAKVLQDKSICGNTMESRKAECLREADCSSIMNKREKDECSRWVGTHGGDAFLCANVEDQMLRDSCYYLAALKDKDMKLCENIYGPYPKLDCYLDAK